MQCYTRKKVLKRREPKLIKNAEICVGLLHTILNCCHLSVPDLRIVNTQMFTSMYNK